MREIKVGWAALTTAAVLFAAGCGGSSSQSGTQPAAQTGTAAPAPMRAAVSGKDAAAGIPGKKTKVAVLKVTGMT